MSDRTHPSHDLAVDVRGLRKSYGDLTVLDGVDLAVPAGTVTALLGPDGAGRTTAVGILSTLLRADAGTVRVAGHDVATDPGAVRAAIGVTGQVSAVDDLLTGAENLRLMAALHHLGRRAGAERAAALLERFGLTDAARKPVSTWSGGMRRKLDLAMTLVGTPSVVFLDEPTTGLDPRSRRTLWDEVRALVAGGTTILPTTQYLDEADRLADRVAVLDRGRIVAEGTPDDLKSAHDAGSFTVAIPVALLLFVFVFGGAFGAGVTAGVAPGAEGRAAYLDDITPAILLFAVLGTVVQGVLAVSLVLGLAVALGFRPDAGALGWLALAGLVVVATTAFTWLCVAMGMAAKSVETASNTPMLLPVLPFFGSGFVPVATMPAAVRWFAEHQPLTPIIETTRGLLAGAPLGTATTLLALGWCLVIGVGGYAWSRALYRRERH